MVLCINALLCQNIHHKCFKMEKLKVKSMTGLIMSSPDPHKLAIFYRDVMGIPFALNAHGDLPKHWECDFEGIHYAVLKGKKSEGGNNVYVPSFVVDDIEQFVLENDLVMLHPLMALGGGNFVGSIRDVDGNTVRLWMTTNM